MKWGGWGTGDMPLLGSPVNFTGSVIRNRFRRGGSEKFLKYKAFYEPQLVSLDASYHKEHEYIWFRGGDLNGF